METKGDTYPHLGSTKDKECDTGVTTRVSIGLNDVI